MAGHRLDEVYERFRTQLGFQAYAKQAALRSTATADLLASLGIPGIGDVVKDRRKYLLRYFDRLDEQVRRQGFIDLVAAFEADLFALIGRAASGARHVLNVHYEVGRPFAEERVKLARAREDILNLGGYRRLFGDGTEGRGDIRQALWEVVSHRDYLAHGQRWAPLATPPTAEGAYTIMSAELARIV